MAETFTLVDRRTAKSSAGIEVEIPGVFGSHVRYSDGKRTVRLPAQRSLTSGVFLTILVEVPSHNTWDETKEPVTDTELLSALHHIESCASLFKSFIVFDRPGTERVAAQMAEGKRV